MPERPILVVGGYGYGNVGDEAQLAGSLELLRSVASGARIKVLSPDPGYTRATHGVEVGEAPRLAFYDVDRSDLYWLPSPSAALRFLFRSLLLYLNALLMARGWPVLLLRRRRVRLLEDLRDSRLLFFCGGGYLTGRTRSRLWEGMLLLRIAAVFGVPTALSGQTVGVWRGRIDRRLARWGFRVARLVTTRDAKSEAALGRIGVRGEHVFTTCDDALFSVAASRDEARARVRSSGVHEGSTPWVALHFHDWGFEAEEQEMLLERARTVVQAAGEAFDGPLLLCPMIPADEPFMERVVERCDEPRLHLLRYGYDHRIVRRVFGLASAVLSMKHHPLVFALGEETPVISLTWGSYYRHKSGGTLALLNAQDWDLDLQAPDYAARLRALLKELPRGHVPDHVLDALGDARRRRARFGDAVGRLLEERAA